MADDLASQLEKLVTSDMTLIQEELGKSINSSIISSAEKYRSEELSYNSKNDFLKFLLKIPGHIASNRSTYLPFEILNKLNFEIPSSSPEVSINFSLKESYENTFMRMLGLPSYSEERFSSLANSYFLVDPETQSLIDVPVGEILNFENQKSDGVRDIFAERQRSIQSRRYNISNSNFFGNNNAKSTNNTETGTNTSAIIQSTPDPLKKEDLFKFFYLKCFPVQDGSIASCINEPEKIILQPFSSLGVDSINGVTPQKSLLETIIRIRLDKLSGSPEVEAVGKSGIRILNTGPERYSELEYFMIRKLYIVLQSLALQYFKSVEEIKSEKKLEQARTNTDGVSSSSTSNSEDSPNVRLDKLQEQRNELLIEESFLLLLKDTGSTKSNYVPTIDYQKNTIRSSSGFEDAISSSLYTILSSKVFFLNKEIEKLERERDSSTTQTKKAESLKSKIGARLAKDLSPISVGAIDIIVYALAFLTVEESTLIGLLNERQTKQLDIDTENKYKFSDDFKNQSNDMSLSINKLTVRVFNLYKIFIDFKNNKDFGVPQSKAV